MPDQISPKTQQKIEKFCSKISNDYDLDDDTYKELCSHIEDKMFDYINGGEPLSEDDAFILVKEHFGNTTTLKAMFRDAHEFEKKPFHLSMVVLKSASIIIAGIFSSWFLYGFLSNRIIDLVQSTGINIISIRFMRFDLIRLKYSIIMGILFTLPFITGYIQLHRLSKRYVLEKNQVYVSATGASFIFFSSVIIMLFLFYPYVIVFGMQFMPRNIQIMVTTADIIKDLFRFAIIISFLLDLPLITIFLVLARILDLTWLSRFRRHAIGAAFIISALITLPDLLSMIMFTFLFILMYEISILTAKLTCRRKQIIHV